MATPPAPTPLDLNNIQGDILSGLPKKTQLYIFFDIVDVTKFRQDLVRFIPIIKTVAGVLKDRQAIDDHKKKKLPGLIPLVGVNISFSHKGFVKLGIDDSSLAAGGASDPFIIGQEQDALTNLGDPKSPDGKTPDWDPHFLQDLHGVILISGDSHGTTDKKKAEIDGIFGSSIKEIITIRGDVRPGAEDGHEHFGFLDGISNPVVIGFDTVINPGPSPVDPGVIVTGQTGDPGLSIRQDWSTDGSFAVFRYLFQEVPEFDDFLTKNPIAKDGNGKVLTPEEGSDLLGARMVGRWKSGAPIDITPFQDDPALGVDPKRNNNFAFAGEITSSLRCPFAAHNRKTNPRDDLEVPPAGISPIPVGPRRIMRRGIQFGPELTAAEKASGKTIHGRGLLFNCYQTSITNGFQFLQHSWADNQDFPPFTSSPSPPGLDPLIGQGTRSMIGLDPLNPLTSISMGIFIIPKGGEYFFSPSISGLKNTIAKA
jgi:Dyp-type peroxidase family